MAAEYFMLTEDWLQGANWNSRQGVRDFDRRAAWIEADDLELSPSWQRCVLSSSYRSRLDSNLGRSVYDLMWPGLSRITHYSLSRRCDLEKVLIMEIFRHRQVTIRRLSQL